MISQHCTLECNGADISQWRWPVRCMAHGDALQRPSRRGGRAPEGSSRDAPRPSASGSAQVAAHRVLLIDSAGAGTWARTTVGGLSNMTNTIAELCPANGGSCSFEWQMSSLWNRTELRRGERCTDVRDPCQCCRSIDSRYDSKHRGKLCNPTQVDHSRCEPVSCVGTNDCHFTPANCTAILQLSCGG